MIVNDLIMEDCKISVEIPYYNGIFIEHDGSSIIWNVPNDGVLDWSIDIPSATELNDIQSTGKHSDFDRLVLSH